MGPDVDPKGTENAENKVFAARCGAKGTYFAAFYSFGHSRALRETLKTLLREALKRALREALKRPP